MILKPIVIGLSLTLIEYLHNNKKIENPKDLPNPLLSKSSKVHPSNKSKSRNIILMHQLLRMCRLWIRLSKCNQVLIRDKRKLNRNRSQINRDKYLGRMSNL